MKQTRAAIYIRQSRTYDDTISPEIQEANCRKLAEREGWVVVEPPFTDIGISGSGEALNKRVGLKALREAYKAGKFDIAIADDLDRFARNVADSSVIRGEMPTATWKEGKQDNKLFADILSAFGEDYLRRIKERWNDALTNRFEKGLPPSGKNQFGYRKNSQGFYEIHEEEASILREAYERYTAGESARMIVNDFTARGLPAPGPAGWHQPGFFDLLDKEFYAGKIVWSPDRAEAKKAKRQPTVLTTDGAHEPILTPAGWAAYRQARTKRKTGARPKDPKWFGAGLVRCGLCDAVMVTHKDSRGVYRLMCSAYSADRNKCKGVFRKRGIVAFSIWIWLESHLQEWASAMPTDEEGLTAAQSALADAEAAVEAATEDYTGFATWAYENKILPSVSAAQLEAKAQTVKDAEQARDEALAALETYAPATDVHERIIKGAELMGFTGEEQEEPTEEATARFRQALAEIIEKVIVYPPSTSSPRDPKRNWLSEIKVVPKG